MLFIIESPLDLHLVEPLGVTDIGEAKSVLFGPEKRYRFKALAPTQNVARRGLSLTLGYHPMLDANMLAVSRSGQRAISPAA